MRMPTIVKMDHSTEPQSHSSCIKTRRYCTLFAIAGVAIFILTYSVASLANSNSASPAEKTNHTPLYSTTTANRIAATDLPNTEASRYDLTSTVSSPETDWEIQILQQVKELTAVGCRPTLQVKHVLTLLAPEDDLGDKDLYPEWVVVGRCLPSCSYCQAPQQCLPTPGTLRNKTFVVRATDDTRTVYRKRQVVEHTTCSCQ
nr:uncharacterized protein LOC123745582 [Procambarus clarkii]